MTRDRKASVNRKKTTHKTGSIRIIAGQFRGRKLPVLNSEGLRPTTDRAKETLFNWLMHDIRNARCLDLFAGSGGLGFEALSRYAKTVTFVEKEAQAADQLIRNVNALKLPKSQYSIIQTDAFDFLRDTQANFDIIFVDPPFGKKMLAPSIQMILNHDLLSKDGLLYVEYESEAHIDWSRLELKLVKEKSTKALVCALLTRQ